MSSDSAASDDPQLIDAWCRQAAAGDLPTLERLLAHYHERFLGLILRKIGLDWRGRIEPEDVLQEAYIEVYADIAGFTYRGPDSFYRWVTRIIDHQFVDHVRRHRRKKRDIAREAVAPRGESSAFDALLDRCASDARTPSADLRRADAVGALMSCIAQLPDDYRVVVQRLYLRQEPLAAIATDLGRSEDAVRRMGLRAIERLRAGLGRASHYLSTHG